MEIRQYSADEVLQNKNEMIEMLRDNYRINIPEHAVSSDFCTDKFSKLVLHMLEGNAFVWVALKNGDLAGFAWGFLFEHYNEKWLHINHVFVKKEHRQTGIARLLMNALWDWARNNGIAALDLYVRNTNDAAVSLYTKMGFEPQKIYMTRKAL
ncbi:MAG: GNAT family N-acetyltransferase [Eubacteriales bacterium]